MNHEKEFGILISLILPGFISLLGIAPYSATVQAWIGTSGPDAPTIGGFLYVTVAAVFLGLLVSTIRWAIIDTIHHYTGIKPPGWDFSRLANREAGFTVLIDIHYRYYQFYGNSIIAILFLTSTRSLSQGFSVVEILAATLTCMLFFAGSRDTLRKYYRRADELLTAL